MKKDKITLKVKEALAKDVGRALARIDPEDMQSLGLEVGDIIVIEGKRQTPAKVMPCYADDRGKGIIQMDGIVRANAQAGLDEKVKLIKADYKPAGKVTLVALTDFGALSKNGAAGGKDSQYIGSLIN